MKYYYLLYKMSLHIAVIKKNTEIINILLNREDINKLTS